jgi:hypothetical protein
MPSRAMNVIVYRVAGLKLRLPVRLQERGTLVPPRQRDRMLALHLRGEREHGFLA